MRKVAKSRKVVLATRPQNFSREWIVSQLDRFERLADEDGSGPAALRASGVNESRLRKLYPFSTNTFTPMFMRLLEDPATFKQLRRAMHPMRARSENDLEIAEQYHWSLYYRSSRTLRSSTSDLMLPPESTVPFAQHVHEIYGGDHFSFAKATLLSRTLHMIPAALNEALQHSKPAAIEDLPLASISQRPYQHMRRNAFRFAEFSAVTEQLLSMLEEDAIQPKISLKAEM